LPQFNYSANSLDRKLYGGKDAPTKIVKVEESVKRNGSGNIPGLVLDYELPEGVIISQLYQGASDCIPANSDLGSLIRRFAALGIDDIDGDSGTFAPINNRYLWLTSIVQTGANGLVHYKRFPKRWMHDREIETSFGIVTPLKFLTGHESLLEEKFDGLDAKNILIKATSIKVLREHLEEVNHCLLNGSLVRWIEQNTSLRLIETDQGQIFKKE
jgi:hypothetical protein